MAEITYQMVLSTLQTTGLLVGIFYYIMTLQNTRKNQQHQLETRQAQLFMYMYDRWSSPEFRKRSNWVNSIIEYDNREDFFSKYGPKVDEEAFATWASIAAFYAGIGVLVKRGLIDIELVADLMRPSIVRTWEKMSPEIFARN